MIIEALEKDVGGGDDCCHGEAKCACYGVAYDPCPTRCDSILYCKWREDPIPG